MILEIYFLPRYRIIIIIVIVVVVVIVVVIILVVVEKKTWKNREPVKLSSTKEVTIGRSKRICVHQPRQ